MQNILSSEGVAAFNKMGYYVFLPALVLTTLGSSASGSKLAKWWFMLINSWINLVLGLGLGALINPIVRAPQQLQPHFLACCGMGTCFHHYLNQRRCSGQCAEPKAASSDPLLATSGLCEMI
jgi:predicted permease